MPKANPTEGLVDIATLVEGTRMFCWCGKKLGDVVGITGAIRITTDYNLQQNAPCWRFFLLPNLCQLFEIASRWTFMHLDWEATFDSSFQSTGLRNQRWIMWSKPRRQTHHLGQGGTAVLIACSALLQVLSISSRTCLAYRKAYRSPTAIKREKNERGSWFKPYRLCDSFH